MWVAKVIEIYTDQEDSKYIFRLRSARVDPTRRRQHIIIDLLSRIDELFQYMGPHLSQGYSLTTNIPSLTLRRMSLNAQQKEVSLLDIFVCPTALNVTTTTTTYLRKLSQSETECLWTVNLSDWICRPDLSDLRWITQMEEYKGTYILGHFFF